MGFKVDWHKVKQIECEKQIKITFYVLTTAVSVLSEQTENTNTWDKPQKSVSFSLFHVRLEFFLYISMKSNPFYFISSHP